MRTTATSSSSGVSEAPALVDALLVSQRELTAVERFAQHHAEATEPLRARTYRDLLPLSAPAPGEQYAFEVDLDACTGCKACVTACHSLNGLALEETWRDVGLMVGVRDGQPIQQTVTTACHHCEDPGCLSGCPVKAYEKDPVTGIVRHLDDQCIGCQYCVLKCPYDVPKYNATLGIVRKCDMCTARLAANEAPACVQGCPSSAIRIEIVARTPEGRTREMLPMLGDALPDSGITRPTTRYVSKRPGALLRPASQDRLRPAHAHDPLAIMLVLLQLSAGTLLFDALWMVLGAGAPELQPWRLGMAAGAAQLGLAAATLHLGRPLYAFRAFLGWRTSWMSREILAFGAYVPLLLALLAGSSALHIGALRALLPPAVVELIPVLLPALELLALGAGLAGTFCSIMIYVDTQRPYWAMARTAPRFAGTLVMLGALGAATAAAPHALLAGDLRAGGLRAALACGLVAAALKLLGETRALRGSSPLGSALDRSRRLLRGPLRGRLRARFAAALAGGLCGLAALAYAAAGAPVYATLLCVAATLGLLLGELLERHLYFTAEANHGMPGH
jgi:Fe-S-cluster-containing dehydrogenase component/DMSO reductase anchor subunit